LTGFGSVPTIYPAGFRKGAIGSLLETVSFQHITRILGVIDDMEISREAVEIPLSPESPGVVRRLSNGKLEIVVDAEMPFDDWLQTLPQKIQGVMPEDMESDS
jgi:methionine synthase II (cobalamin-independent)